MTRAGRGAPDAADRTPRRVRAGVAGRAARAALVLWVAIAVLGPLVVADPLRTRGADGAVAPLRAPSAAHWLGTDDVGRDVLARLVHGARASLLLAAGAAALALALGVLAGATAAGRPRVRAAVLAVCDLLGALPPLLVAVAAQGLVGGRAGPVTLVVLIALPRAGDTARLCVHELDAALAAPHAEAARALGAGRARLLYIHGLRVATPALAAATAVTIAAAVLTESALGFLGLGLAAPTPSWGDLLAQAHRHQLVWWLAVPAGLCVTLLALAAQRAADEFSERR